MGANGGAQQRQAVVKGQLTSLERQDQSTPRRDHDKQTELGGMFSARQIADAKAQIAGLQDKLRTIAGQLRGVAQQHAQGATNTISVIEPADCRWGRLAPKWRHDLAGGCDRLHFLAARRGLSARVP